jgi:hypothetical protein
MRIITFLQNRVQYNVTVMHPDLQCCRQIIEAATRGGGAECNARRDPDKWSVAEVVEHLQRAYLGNAKGFERCLEKGELIATPRTLKQTLQAFAVVTLGYFPEGRQAPKHVIPTGELDLSAVVAAVVRDLDRLDAAAIRIRQRFGGSTKVLDHPVLGAFSVDQWLKFHLIHTRHHEKQIRARR